MRIASAAENHLQAPAVTPTTTTTGDALSDLRFHVSFNIQSTTLKQSSLGYTLKSGRSLDILLHMDGLKQYTMSFKEIKVVSQHC